MLFVHVASVSNAHNYNRDYRVFQLTNNPVVTHSVFPKENALKLLLVLCLCFFLVGCGPKAPASIKERGLKPVNDLRYYPYLSDSERAKFEKLREKENAPQKSRKASFAGAEGETLHAD